MSQQFTHDPAVPIIELRGVTKTYFNGDLATQVLHGVDLKIYPGEFVAIMGASGSGKSTMMNILGCLDRPTTGQYLFKGRDVSDFDRDELCRAGRHRARLDPGRGRRRRGLDVRGGRGARRSVRRGDGLP